MRFVGTLDTMRRYPRCDIPPTLGRSNVICTIRWLVHTSGRSHHLQTAPHRPQSNVEPEWRHPFQRHRDQRGLLYAAASKFGRSLEQLDSRSLCPSRAVVPGILHVTSSIYSSCRLTSYFSLSSVGLQTRQADKSIACPRFHYFVVPSFLLTPSPLESLCLPMGRPLPLVSRPETFGLIPMSIHGVGEQACRA